MDVLAMGWGTLGQCRASRQPPPGKGGWSTFVTSLNGTNNFDPAGQLGIRGNGDQAWFSWPRAPRLEALRVQGFAAPDAAGQKVICAEIQRPFFIDVPYLRRSAYYEAMAYHGVTGLRTRFRQSYDVRPA